MWLFLFLCTFLPFWWRFCQCLNKFYETGLQVHVINAGKYFSKMMPSLILLFDIHCGKMEDENFMIFFLLNMFATTYCLCWDFYMDWGLFRCFETEKFLLRKMLTFRPQLYYFAMLNNFVLRYAWVGGIVTLSAADA